MDDLAVRKELLLAQSAMQRAQLRLILLAGRARTASWIGKAAGFLAIARTILSAIRLLKG